MDVVVLLPIVFDFLLHIKGKRYCGRRLFILTLLYYIICSVVCRMKNIEVFKSNIHPLMISLFTRNEKGLDNLKNSVYVQESNGCE